MKPRPHHGLTLLWLCAVLACPACRFGSSGDAPEETPPDQPRPTTLHDGPTIPGNSVTSLASFSTIEPINPDPAADQWTSEVLSEQVLGQLKRLAELLGRPGELRAEALQPLLEQEITGSPLRPEKLQAVFQDGAWLIRRGAIPEQATRFHGPAGFVEAAAALFSSFEAPAAPRITFKIAGIRADDDAITTELFFHADVHSGETALAQSARWDCRWWKSDSGPPKLISVDVQDFEETVAQQAAGPLFADCTEAVLGANPSYHEHLAYGIDHWLERVDYQYLSDTEGYQGITVGDVNGDGLDDLYVVQPGGLPNRLFVQQPDGTALDVSAASGADWWEHSLASLLLDLDHDGDQDLVIATMYGLIFMANDGLGKFSPVMGKLSPAGQIYGLAAADFDNDGDVDIYVCCYVPHEQHVVGRFMARPVPFQDANNGGRNMLLRNDRNWNFKDVANQVGLDENNARFSYAASWEDFDNDGDQDLYVANDFGRNNLYRNDDGYFSDIAADVAVEDQATGMSAAWSDYNNDGWMDIYVGNMWSSAGNRIIDKEAFQPQAGSRHREAFGRFVRGNSLFANTKASQGRTFVDVSISAGVNLGRWAWSSNFVDLNNDGWEDIVVANGFITQEDTGDL